MAESGHRQRLATKKTLWILSAVTFVFALDCAVCGGWWKYQRDQARDELAEAARSGSWEKYQAALRNEWPALEWFAASVILLLLAMAFGGTTLFYWILTRRQQKSPDSP